MPAIAESEWVRGDFTSVWEGPDLTLIVVQGHHTLESWSWACRGWREPEEAWVWAPSREAAEKAAMAFYLED